MRRGQVTLSFVLLLAAAAAGLTTIGSALDEVDPQTLHPERSIVYFSWDGVDQHREALQQTAQYEAFVESGLLDYGVRLLDQSLESLARQRGPLSSNELQLLNTARQQLADVYRNGFSFSATDGTDNGLAPMATLVLNQAAGAVDLVPMVLQLAGLKGQPDLKPIDGRDVRFLRSPRNPALEVAWWVEGNHLVVAIGIEPAERAIALANGDAANVTSHALWQKCLGEDQSFEVAGAGWLRFSDLRERFGQMPVPLPNRQKQATVADVAKLLGLHNLQSVATQFGYRGKACMSRSFIEAPGERTGLLSLLDQPQFTLDDLPPLPPDSMAFAASSVDAVKTYDVLRKVAGGIADLVEPDGAAQLAEMEAALPGMLGFNLRDDLLQSLGSINCFYGDPAAGPFGLGFGFAASVRDSEKLTAVTKVTAERVAQMLQQEDLPFATALQHATVDGRQLLTLPLGGVAPTVGVGQNWLSIGLFPQSVKAFFMRADGKLDRWQPTEEHEAAFAELPKRFSTISVNDPREGLRTLYSLVPMLNSAVHTAAPSLGPNAVMAAELPPQEVVTRSLFPNVSVSVPDDNGVQVISRSSLPAVPAPSAESALVAPVLVALLLPAVQQAREAARRTQSRNNLKLLGLALHNYHDVWTHFPAGTEPDTNLKPSQRLSFYFALLPYMEQAALYQVMEDHRKTAWNQEENQLAAATTLTVLQNPAQSPAHPASTHYLGVSGVGEDAPELPIGHERAGIFGFDRKTRIRDIADGTSNTAMMTETWKEDIPWAAGQQTLVSLTQEPYINGEDGIGSPFRGGCHVLMADGSVQFISEQIDAETVRRMAAMADGKILNNFR